MKIKEYFTFENSEIFQVIIINKTRTIRNIFPNFYTSSNLTTMSFKDDKGIIQKI